MMSDLTEAHDYYHGLDFAIALLREKYQQRKKTPSVLADIARELTTQFPNMFFEVRPHREIYDEFVVIGHEIDGPLTFDTLSYDLNGKPKTVCQLELQLPGTYGDKPLDPGHKPKRCPCCGR